MPTDFKDSRDAGGAGDAETSSEAGSPRDAEAAAAGEGAAEQLVYGVGDERVSLTTRTREALYRFRVGLQEGMPLPLVIQGGIEAIQVYVLGLLVVALPVAGAAMSGGWLGADVSEVARVTGRWWLLGHGVPLVRSEAAIGGAGTMWFLPLGFVVLPGWLAWRAGRRLARASWSDQLWQAMLGSLLVYGVLGIVTTWWASSELIASPWWGALLIPLVIHGLGLIGGAWREAGSFGRLIGFNAAERVLHHSQYQRWAGSYVWAVVRAGFVGLVMAVGLASAAFTVQLVVHWVDVINTVMRLNPGLWGGAALMLLQLVFVPNMVMYTLAYVSGGGFALGSTTSISAFGSFGTDMPPLPVLGMLPDGPQVWVVAIPVLAGVVAGWWFMREGENHLEEWLTLRFSQRWIGVTLSSLMLGLLVGAVSAVGFVVLALLSSGTLGLGIFTWIGPHVWVSAGLLVAEIGVGAVLGNVAAPLFERDPVLDD